MSNIEPETVPRLHPLFRWQVCRGEEGPSAGEAAELVPGELQIQIELRDSKLVNCSIILQISTGLVEMLEENLTSLG